MVCFATSIDWLELTAEKIARNSPLLIYLAFFSIAMCRALRLFKENLPSPARITVISAILPVTPIAPVPVPVVASPRPIIPAAGNSAS